jgi:LPS sulfotransferase NodH
MDKEIIKRNTASREAMQKLAQHFTNTELEHKLSNGWTVAVMFAHLAFWDKQRYELLKSWQKNGISMSACDYNVLNAAMLPFWESLEPRLAVQMALENAAEVDALIEKLSDDFVSKIRKLPDAPDLERANHRLHHLKQLR